MVERGNNPKSKMHNESIYLNVLEEIIQNKQSPAKELTKSFTQKYNHSMQELLKDIAY